jgi:UDP-GlcNAc:undecaprenyl-phosphate GlcNAc-1-phosphate transferase
MSGAALVTAAVLTPMWRSVARRLGVVARPAPDRWHRQATALLGGVAIFLASAVGVTVGAAVLRDGRSGMGDLTAEPLVGVGLSAVFMFVVGVIDDVRHLRPQLKFILQTLAGVLLVSFGGILPLSPWYGANVVITLFWFVGVTNAFNLLDNMDGVAAGVAALASVFLGITLANHGAWLQAGVAWALGGAALGFLRYNFPPASIFMGDAGSLFLGSALAGLAVSSPAAASESLVSVLFVPLTIVAVPVFDTALVTVTRTLAGRPISQGGRDHSTHRLVALGLRERHVAVLLYAFAAVCGLVALVLTGLDRGLGTLLGVTFLVVMGLLAAYLGRLQVAPLGKVRQPAAMTLLVGNFLHKRRLAELMLDVALVAMAYYGAYRLRFDGVLPPEYATAFEATVALVIAVNVVAFALFGVYRGAWDYAGIFDVYRVVGAILASGAVVFAYAEWRVPVLAQSHSIVYIDTVLAMALVLASRLSFKSLELIRDRLGRHGARVLIYGADDGGELTLRELRNHGDLGLRPVCFVDDDARRHGAEIHGVPIVAGFDGLAWAVARYRIDKVVIGTRKLAPEAAAMISALARQLGLEVAEVSFKVSWIAASGPALESQSRGAAEASVATGGNGTRGATAAAEAAVTGGLANTGGLPLSDVRVAG